MDRARRETDRNLKQMEREIGRVYKGSSALLSFQKEYDAYMKYVAKQTESAYKAYINETDIKHKAELKKAYSSEIKTLTLESKKYRSLVKKFAEIMAQVNQEALDIVNAQMANIYAVNYNAVAVECKKVGIKVDGKE